MPTWNPWGRNGDWRRCRDAIAADAAADVCGLQEV
jgi:hypothetical protein